MTKPTARLENWIVFGKRVFGDMRDHRQKEDADKVMTSTIVRQTETEIETLNTIYKLGRPAP